MLNFVLVRAKEITLQELTADLTVTELRRLTDEMVNAMLSLIAGCTDAALFAYELFHDDSHLGQIAEIVRQAKVARISI